jgi:hypothetical protein
MPLPSNGPRLTCPLTHEALLLKNFNLRESGEGYPGTALRKGMLAAQHRLEDMGLREPDPHRVKVILLPAPPCILLCIPPPPEPAHHLFPLMCLRRRRA